MLFVEDYFIKGFIIEENWYGVYRLYSCFVFCIFKFIVYLKGIKGFFKFFGV